MIKRCNCEHEVQDKLHGKGNRVFNEVKHPNGAIEVRCTVCGKSEKLNVKEGK